MSKKADASADAAEQARTAYEKAMNAVDVKRAEVELAEATVAKEDAVEDAAAVKAKNDDDEEKSAPAPAAKKRSPFRGRSRRGFA